ncbi:carbohydrate kinase family protein [Streptomyces sp. Ru73]|uniref:carbohydrate kinase family protein n=1 Tax=Streptomyces sp. Ru73 TaxID=2080748 RepID=UPI000CDD0156|nr:carbohydrate kinase family protein [Streptomyces sp. Ru73]POX42493.1 carbohydrate kinase family protein [Streptomyces sp. Ru73]
MRIAVTGSIATDYLTTFTGRFADQLLPDQLAHVSLSFLVDDLRVRHGGTAANIAYGLGTLGLDPLLLGAVGADFAPYRDRLEAHGVDTRHVRVSDHLGTARFLCTTDLDQNQIASFYAGAMTESALLDLAPLAASADRPGLVVVSAGDPAAMERHTVQCRELGLPFAADPSQQLARLDGEQARGLVTGARWLFTNAYEAALLTEVTGWRRADVLARVGTWVTTHGAAGVVIESAAGGRTAVPAVATASPADPTGGGDAFRAGFLAATARGADPTDAARLGCALATAALEAVGPQEYSVTPRELLSRIATAYGAAAARALSGALAVPAPAA